MAARINISDLYKNTTSDLRKYAHDLISYEYRGSKILIIHPTVVAFIDRYYSEVERVVDYDRDYVNNFFGATMLIKSYLLSYKYDKSGKLAKERPQQMLLRVAIGEDGSASKDTYYLLVERYYTCDAHAIQRRHHQPHVLLLLPAFGGRQSGQHLLTPDGHLQHFQVQRRHRRLHRKCARPGRSSRRPIDR